MIIRTKDGQLVKLNISEEIEFLRSELPYFQAKWIQLCRYSNFKNEIVVAFEYHTYDPDRYVTMFNISEDLFALLMGYKCFEMKKNKNKNRESVLEISNSVDADALRGMLNTCSRSLIIDEVLADLEA